MTSSLDVANILADLYDSPTRYIPYKPYWYHTAPAESTFVNWYDSPTRLNYDCGNCINCKDKPKFGGCGIRKQRCVNKIQTRFDKSYSKVILRNMNPN